MTRRKNMNFAKILLTIYWMFFCSHSYAEELSTVLQKACLNEQLNLHKGVKGPAIEARKFNEYCQCETDHIISRATKEQLNQISKNQTVKPSWLPQFKFNALKSCTAQDKKTTT